MSRASRLARRLWAAALSLAETRRGAVALFAAALVVWVVESVGWPLAAGRDLGAYLLVYVDLFNPHAVLPWAMLNRTPLSALVAGATLEVGNSWFLEAFVALLFAGSVVAWAVAARAFGQGPAVVVGLGVLLYPGYGIVFHGYTGDTVYAAGFAGFAVLFVRAGLRPTAGRLAWVGLGVALLVLMRPSSLPFLALAFLPFVLPGTWRERLGRGAAVALVAAIPLLAWSVHNAIRFDDFTIVRGGNASLPLFRAFVTDTIVSPANGPASRELAEAVRTKLLTEEPYRAYDIDLHAFFTSGSPRMHEDLVSLSDRVWGWDSDYALLGRVGREAVEAHPGVFARDVSRSFWELLEQPLFAGRVAPAPTPAPSSSPPPAAEPDTVVVDGVALPRPEEGDLIPSERMSVRLSTPDGSIRVRWLSATTRVLVFDDPKREARYYRNWRRLDELVAVFPHRWWSPWVGLQLDRSSKLYPRLWMLILAGLLGIAIRRPVGWPVVLSLTASALLVLLLTVLATYAVPNYAVVLAPAFLLLAAVGVLGERVRSA